MIPNPETIYLNYPPRVKLGVVRYYRQVSGLEYSPSWKTRSQSYDLDLYTNNVTNPQPLLPHPKS